ncbi:MAG: nucleotidyltransferase domain-containing protein [Bacteroidaceae bacterium]|nr:nucleotidyltransferase domain-containing protein [Bacteroidaceae bacterium]
MNAYLDAYRPTIAVLCRKHNVKHLYLFGSVLTSRFNENSDVDMLVEFEKDQVKDYFSNFFDLKYALEEMLGRVVDLVVRAPISNPVFKRHVEQTKQKIYG